MSVKKNFAVIGLGTFGYETAVALFENGAEVLALDKDEALIQRIRNDVTQAVCGDATNPEVLRATGVLDADAAIVAIRNHFETTVHVTHLLKSFEMKEVYVQVNSASEASAIVALGADQAIFPESDMAGRFARQLLYTNLAGVLPVSSNLGIIKVPIPESYEGKTFVELEIRKKHHVTVVAVQRRVKQGFRYREVVLETKPEEPLEKGDVLLVLGNHERLSRFKGQLEEEVSSEKD